MKVDGAFLERRRLELGLAQSELARSSGVDAATISRIERGLAGAHMSSLRRLAAVLEVAVTDLYAEKLESPAGVQVSG